MLRLNSGSPAVIGRRIAKAKDKLRIAVICNWDQSCGISTYSRYLANALRPGSEELHIFSEHGVCHRDDTDSVSYCWKRGESMTEAIGKALAWEPDFVSVQHEFGLFPKATHLLRMLQQLDQVPYAVTLHSTYEHLDKSVCTSAMKSIVVHSNAAKNVLERLGNTSRVSVVPHGCVQFAADERKENWNIFQTPYAIIQFGFGFEYKGVDRAIDAIRILKARCPEKYADAANPIFYAYLCSENPNTRNVHSNYYQYLVEYASSRGVSENMAIVRKYHSDEEINNYLRTAKLALFPYVNNPNNTVYGASGAIRIAMANGIPVIASESHLFDELPVPRPTSAEELAVEIDRVFSSSEYKAELVARQDDYIGRTTWPTVADQYHQVFQRLRSEMFTIV